MRAALAWAHVEAAMVAISSMVGLRARGGTLDCGGGSKVSEIGPDAPEIIGAEVLARNSAIGRNLNLEAVFARNGALPLEPVRHGRLDNPNLNG